MTHHDPASKGEKMVTLDEAKEQVRRVCVRLACLHYAFAKTLVDELGDEKGKQMAMNAIKLYSRMIGEEVRDKARAKGLDTSPQNYGEDLPQYGMHEGREVLQVGAQRRTRAFGCVMGKVWRDMGPEAAKLGRIYCCVDPAKYMAYNPNFKLIHYKALPDGDDYCELGVVPTTEADKKAFAAKDTDLSKLDK
jgi:hypothetical protein